MPDPISDHFATANGIAAFALAQEILVYLESTGMPRDATVRLTLAAQQVVRAWSQATRHPSLPLAADLLGAVALRLRSPPDVRH